MPRNYRADVINMATHASISDETRSSEGSDEMAPNHTHQSRPGVRKSTSTVDCKNVLICCLVRCGALNPISTLYFHYDGSAYVLYAGLHVYVSRHIHTLAREYKAREHVRSCINLINFTSRTRGVQLPK